MTDHKRPHTDRSILLVGIPAALAILLYARTSTFGFVRADDTDLIAGNQTFLSAAANIPRAFTRSYFETESELTEQKTYYRPLTIVSFMVDAWRGGDQPRPYHTSNVVLHALATGLLVLLSTAWGASRNSAAAAGVLFAVHPLNVQAVAWIAGRNDLLLAVFALIALMTWSQADVRWLSLSTSPRRASTGPRRSLRGSSGGEGERPAALQDKAKRTDTSVTAASDTDGNNLAGVIHIIAFACALFAKETGVFVPLISVLHQRLVRGARLNRIHWIMLALDAVVAVVWLVLRTQALAEGEPNRSFYQSLTVLIDNTPQVLVQIGKVLFPFRLNVSPGVDVIGLVVGALAAVALTAFAVKRIPPRDALLGAGWVLLFLAPTLLVPGLPAYEHRMYVPLAGLLVAASRAQIPPTRVSTAAIFLAVVVTFAWMSWSRQEVFRSPFTYWQDATRDARYASIAHVNLGQLHDEARHPGEARLHFQLALDIDPNTPKAHNNLGVVLMQLGQPDAARRQFVLETQRHPDNADAWFNLGLWAELRGQNEMAADYWRRAVAVNRYYLAAYEKLQAYHLARGETGKAREYRERLEAIKGR
jgi:protein O-mannosyl-transferase